MTKEIKQILEYIFTTIVLGIIGLIKNFLKLFIGNCIFGTIKSILVTIFGGLKLIILAILVTLVTFFIYIVLILPICIAIANKKLKKINNKIINLKEYKNKKTDEIEKDNEQIAKLKSKSKKEMLMLNISLLFIITIH